MIEVQQLTKAYKDITAIKDINLTIEKGEIFGIIGYSGAGKSTLLRCLNLLEKPTREAFSWTKKISRPYRIKKFEKNANRSG